MVYSVPIDLNGSGDKWSSVDGSVLQYIEWNVELTQVYSVDTIEMICVVEWFEWYWDIIFWTWWNGHWGRNWVCDPQTTQTVEINYFVNGV